ncbi:MAG: SiaB family protein kinase [Bacteroidota bacterium]
MKETNISIGTDYMDFVDKFHQTMVNQQLVLIYEGEVNQAVTKTFSAMAKSPMNDDDDSRTVKKVYHVMVECLQNIFKHADDPETGLPQQPGNGIFMISKNEGKYMVTTGNVVARDKVEGLAKLLDMYNEMTPEEIKDTYRKAIRGNSLSDKAGAGLGFIDIIKKTGNKMHYDFRPINDKTAFFIQRSEINRN